MVCKALLAGAALLSVAAAQTPRPDASRFTYYNISTPLAGPCDLYTAGPDNDIYVSTFLADKLIHINPRTGQTEEITIPYTRKQLPVSVLPQRLQGAGSCVVQPGNDGNVYLATGIRNELVQFNPKTKAFKFFANTGGAAGNLQPFNDMWPGDGGMWFTQTTANVLTFFDFKTEKMTEYPTPTFQGNPVGVIVVGENVWICEFLGQSILKFNIPTKKFTKYSTIPYGLFGPAVTRAYTDQKYIWFTSITSNAIGRVDVNTGEMKAYFNDKNLGLPIEDTADGNENVWFSTALSNTLNYVSHKTGEIVAIQQPNPGNLLNLPLPISLPPGVGIASHWDEPTNSIWFTNLALNQIGKYQLTGFES